MPTFATPHPITVAVDISVGDIRITAAERTDTVVEVRPTDPNKKGDVTAAGQTTVDYAGGRLVVRGPQRARRQFSFRGRGESIGVEIALPAGSQVRVDADLADVRCTGTLGECTVKTGVGAVEIDRVGALAGKVGAGSLAVREATGHTEIRMGSGEVRVTRIDGSAVLRNSNGDTWVGTVTGDCRLKSANGGVRVDRSRATVAAKTANGKISFGEVGPGAVVAETAMGSVEIGVRNGVAAWLDLNTQFGKVHNELGPAGRPGAGEPTVEVRAATTFGDITVRRSPSDAAGAA